MPNSKLEIELTTVRAPVMRNVVSGTNQTMSLFKKIEELEKKTAEVPGAEIIGKINRLEYSHQLFSRNHKHFLDILEGIIEEPEIRDRIFSRNFRWKSDLLFREISFRLHNFVASAISLRDHSRRVYKKVYKNKGQFEEYDKRVKPLLKME